MTIQFISRQRLCPACKIHWDRCDGLECPKCKSPAFLTMNSGDAGALRYFESTGDRIMNYKRFVGSNL
jgi:hypothetical protein